MIGIFPVRISAWFFLGFWFLYQLFEANAGLVSSQANGGGVAFFAHVGGFLFGVLVARLYASSGRLQTESRPSVGMPALTMSTATKPGLQVRTAQRRNGASASAAAPMPVAVAPRTVVLFVARRARRARAARRSPTQLRSILTQFVVAIVLAMAAEPVVQAFERRGLSRGKAVGISFGLLVVALVAFGYILLAPLVDESTRFIHDSPQLLDQLSHGNGRLGFLEQRFQIVERAKDGVGSGGCRSDGRPGPGRCRLGGAHRQARSSSSSS